MASAELGGLGARDGRPVTYNWVQGSLLPVAAPWLAMLLLLVLKPNRRLAAWWIWAPLGLSTLGLGCLPALWPSAPSELVAILQDLTGALLFGLAGVWLLGSYLKSRSRFLNVLGFLLGLLCVSLLIFALTQDWDTEGNNAEAVGLGVAISAGVISVAGGLAGLLCRRRYRPVVLCLWLPVLLLLVGALLLVPLALLQTGGRVPLSQLLPPVLVVAGLCFAALLPFLVLSFANGLYRQRLIQMFSLAPAPAPPIIEPPPGAGAALPLATVQRLKAAAAAALDHGTAGLESPDLTSD